MPPVGFETTISTGERPQTYALDRSVTGTSIRQPMKLLFSNLSAAGRYEGGFKLQRAILSKVLFLDLVITLVRCGIWGSLWILQAC
jgi:hypothetical protein